MPVDPRAAYRVQLQPGFGFAEAAALADYLAALGVSHLYCSPCLQAVAGSLHGYDVVDYTRVNEDLGGEAGHAELVRALAHHGLGQLLDLVPNHMAIATPGNRWWWDVLENGPSSRYAAYFDVEWEPPEARLKNLVLLPVLDDHYGRVLERGDLRLARAGGTFTVRYRDSVWPVAPSSIGGLLRAAAARCGSDELAFLADAHEQLPLSTTTDRLSVRRRHRDKEVLRSLLARLCAERVEVAEALDAELLETNASPDALHVLLERQNYRLAHWRAASRDLGYRRFFDINSLAAVRCEDERVFEDTHERVLRWIADGTVDGVRVDHADGLRDPEGYFARLAAREPKPWVVAEKILMAGETLPASWRVDGTTGYDFMAGVGALFVDPAGAEAMTRFYGQFTGEATDFASLVREKKDLVLREVLGSDLNRLTALFLQVCERHRRNRDYTRHELHQALREVIVELPVYRTYVRAELGELGERDAQTLAQAVAACKARRPDLDPALFDFLLDLLLLRVRGDAESELVMRLQQTTGPAMAKGVEDTAFYCFNRLVSLNDVGGDPGRFGIEPDAFHRHCHEIQAHWPRTLLATSTHDSKRSEDVRARISLLSEIPARWESAVRRWSASNERHRRGGPPDRNAEYLFYQTLIGAWPIDAERAGDYMEKAAREARQHTSWTKPDAEYEEALRGFVETVLDDTRFVADLETFLQTLVAPGRTSSLAQTLLKLTAPGVPDLYQGTELWDLSLVDPDNRRPVDYARRRKLLAGLGDLSPEKILARIDDGLPKLWVVRQALHLRRSAPHLFDARSRYDPVVATGSRARHVVAFVRGGGVMTLVPRLVLGLGNNWGDTSLSVPAGTWRNLLTGETVPSGVVRVADLLRRFPVALVAREGA